MKNIDWSKGLIPAVVQHADTGRVLMLAYMNEKALAKTQSTKRVTFYSRSREKLWTKGETSGHFLDFVSLKSDCDGDTLLIQARPNGPVCHEGTATCFGEEGTEGGQSIAFLNQLQNIIDSRFENPPAGSYVAKLVSAGLDRMAQKVGEEAVEMVIEAKNQDLAKFEGEASDLLFHLMVLLKAKGSSLGALAKLLQSRHK